MVSLGLDLIKDKEHNMYENIKSMYRITSIQLQFFIKYSNETHFSYAKIWRR
jgi:hypothetical protein